MISSEKIKSINEIVDRAYLDFTYTLVGNEFFSEEDKKKVESLGMVLGRRPLIEILYLLARLRVSKQFKDQKTLDELLESINKKIPLVKIDELQKETLQNAKQMTYETIKANKNELLKKINQNILTYNNQVKIKQAIRKVSKKEEETGRKDFLKMLGASLLAALPTFERDITTPITNTINYGKVDEIIGKLEDKAKDAAVYKTVVNDTHLCQWCYKFYIDSSTGKPRIFKLKELAANGSNQGKSKDQWKPTVGLTHPRCRCELHYLED